MLRFHVHIYQTPSKAEMDIDAESKAMALIMALETANTDLVSFGDSDCKKLAVVVDVDTTKTVVFGR